MLKKIMAVAQNAAKDKSGATAIEYGLIAAVIAVVIIGVATTVGEDLVAVFEQISADLKGAID